MAGEEDKSEDALNEEDAERTFIYTQPIFPEGYAAGPHDAKSVMAKAGPHVYRTVQVTGQERFEHMLLYCLTLLQKAKGSICAFYIEDFDSDEFTVRVLQQLIGRCGYVTSDFREHGGGAYKGFWAWTKK
jgi:hypothetical protein